MERTPAWERGRVHSQQYSRRNPTEQILYRIVYHYKEEFEYCWSESFEHNYGCLRDEVKEAFDGFLDCGILLHECSRAVCEDCGHSELIPFSCKRKYICGSCDAKRALLFGEHLHENVLLREPHVHQVFSIPKILRPRFKFNRSLLHLLFSADEIEKETVDLIYGWQYSGFHVFTGEPIGADDAEARQFIGRYLKKSAVLNCRLELIENNNPVVRIHKKTDDGGTFKDFDPLEFLAELAQHVPSRREQTVRYLGKYSARSRGAKRLAMDFPGPLPEWDPPKRPSPSWARCMAKTFELDPLECPKCGGVMQIKAFMHSLTEINKIADNLGIITWRAPPPLTDFKHAA